MVIVDTSVWISHFRKGDVQLKSLLSEAQVTLHPFVFGELACGNFSDRKTVFSLLAALPPAVVAEHHELLELIEHKKLWGTGLGFIDMHLLASARISSLFLFTYDKPLALAARKLGVLY
jgi:predicted nucleic acid-binding protein